MSELTGTLPFDAIRLEMDTEGRYRMYFVNEGADIYYVEVPMPVRGESLTVSKLIGEMPYSVVS